MRFNRQPDNAQQTDSLATPSSPTQPRSEAAPAPAPAVSAPAVSPNGRAAQEERAFLDRGSKVSGKISFEGPARIDGQVEGEIAAKDALTISESARITAQIRAASVVVAGNVTGDIIATTRIEIRPSAHVKGNLSSPALVVHEGAVFDGNCSMRSDETREERKAAPKEERVVQAPAAHGQGTTAPARPIAP